MGSGERRRRSRFWERPTVLIWLLAVDAVAILCGALLAHLAFPALLGLHFLLFSLAELLFFGIDKQLARAERRRLSELNLALTALLGGSFGGFVGMLLFRHKTQHGLFKYGLPILVFVHIVLLAIVMSGAGPES